MEVTRANFREILPEVTKVINDATFVCIDGEFTGLTNGEGVTAYDTPTQYYHKVCNTAMDFLFFQFGLAAFRNDPDKKRYTYKAYNFYVFPRPYNKTSKDYIFMCQSSSIEFLALQGFDFNKVFKEGIPYLCEQDEQNIRDSLEEKRRTKIDIVPIPDDLKDTVEKACQQVKLFLETEEAEVDVTLEVNNAFTRKLLFQEVENRFSKNEVILIKKTPTLLMAKRVNGAEDRRKIEEEKQKKEDAELDEAVGFTQVIRLLSKSGKIIIGHNMLLDMLHITKQFFVPLPDTYEDFKEALHLLFPKLIDTKHMCVTPPFKELLKTSVLVNLLPELKKAPFSLPEVECEDGKGYSSGEVKYHEAGYDAYVTGLVFLTFLTFLSNRKNLADKNNHFSFLRPYLNRIHLMKVADTHINLGGLDPVPQRDHVFHVTFPKDWKHSKINNLFSPFGSIQIRWINDTSAWVALNQDNKSAAAKEKFSKDFSDLSVIVTPYLQYMKQSSSKLHPATSPATGFSSPDTVAAVKRRQVESSVSSSSIDSKKRKKSTDKLMKGIICETIKEEAESPLKIDGGKQSCVKTKKEKLTKSGTSPKKKMFEENDLWD